jgi:hypothetical protein
MLGGENVGRRVDVSFLPLSSFLYKLPSALHVYNPSFTPTPTHTLPGYHQRS